MALESTTRTLFKFAGMFAQRPNERYWTALVSAAGCFAAVWEDNGRSTFISKGKMDNKPVAPSRSFTQVATFC
jgi:hypothetical protein